MSSVPEDLSTTEAARLLDVTVPTIHQWASKGVLQSWKTPGGQRRISRSSVEKLLQEKRAKLGGDQAAGFTILLVEDDLDFVNLVRKEISSWSPPVNLLVASDGFEGLIQAGVNKPNLIIADLVMPEMNGFQMIRSLRENAELKSTRMVVATALDEAQIAEQGGLPSDVTVFIKPVSFPRLETLVQEMASEQGAGSRG